MTATSKTTKTKPMLKIDVTILNKDPRWDKLKSDVWTVWGEIAPDAGECRPAEAVEMALDASRLTTHGYKDSDDYLTELIDKHGYTSVAKTIQREVGF